MVEGQEEVRRRNPLGLPSKYADLSLDGQARLEVRTDRVREERCSPALSVDPSSGCRGSFRAPSLDNQVNIRSTGILGRRIHVNVDFDTEREYTSNNDIQIYYEGLEDEIVRRVDVGTVTFQPPSSRFITAAVPANNFGVNAIFDFGPIELQTLAATQKGSVVAERTYTIGQTTSQAQDRQARDLDFESGRFFWVVDPDSVPGTPAVDILELDPTAVPATYRPTEVRVYRYRAARGNSGVNPNLGGITASAGRGGTLSPLPRVRWELLIQGSDYYLDASGLWIVMGTKLDQNDYLAVSFRTAAGGTIGTFPEVDDGPGSTDVLELIAEPQQTQDRRSFRHEMRNVYRVAGSDLDPASLQVGITLNRSERPIAGTAETYLQQLGLADRSDATLFDRDNRLWPRARDPEAAQVVGDRYIVFPHLEPFADPARLSAPEITDSLYRTPVYLLLTEGPTSKFALRLRYDASGGGDRSTLSLNALQVREGSEQLFVAGRKLERDVDYRISYEVGQVTFINPDLLFGQGSAQVTARFEERGIFAVAPTTILGMSTRYSLGDRGAINLIGMYQREQSAFTRPALGFEATANLIGGVNTELHFRPQGITRFLNSLTSSSTTAPSLFDVNAEFAFTKPDANRSGEAYLEEFESESGLQVPMREAQWEFGSQPENAAGLEDIGFAAFDPADAVQLIWQNLVPISSTNPQPIELRPQDIDTLIRLAGRGEQPEPVMYMTLHADTAGGIVQRNNHSRWSQPRRDFFPRWRSMVTGLSTTGLDLTRNEFLEFWVFQPSGEPADSAGLRLIFDLGTVSEDAVALAPDTLQLVGEDSVFTGRQFVGQGQLDTERSEVGIFNAQVDDIGILGDRPPIFEIPDGAIGELLDLQSDAGRGGGSLPLGRPERALQPGQRGARHRRPRRRPAARRHHHRRRRVPLRGGPRAPRFLRARRRHQPGCPGSHRHLAALPYSAAGVHQPHRLAHAPAGEAAPHHLRHAARRGRARRHRADRPGADALHRLTVDPARRHGRSSASRAPPPSRMARSPSASSAPRIAPISATSRPPASATTSPAGAAIGNRAAPRSTSGRSGSPRTIWGTASARRRTCASPPARRTC